MVERYLSKKLKTEVTLSSIDFSKSHLKIQDFAIKNLGGKEKKAFSSQSIDVKYYWNDLTRNPSQIESVELNKSYLLIECKNNLCTKNNWTKIIKNISKREVLAREKREVIIKKIVMRDLTVDVRGMGITPLAVTKKVNIPYIEFKDVNSKDGFPTQELIAAIFKKVGLMDYIKGVFNKNGIIDKFFNFPKLFGENIEGKYKEEMAKHNR